MCDEKLQSGFKSNHRGYKFSAMKYNGGKTNYFNGKNNFVSYISVITPTGIEKRFSISGDYPIGQLKRIIQQEINNYCDLKPSKLDTC